MFLNLGGGVMREDDSVSAFSESIFELLRVSNTHSNTQVGVLDAREESSLPVL